VTAKHSKTCCIITDVEAMTRNLDEHLTKLRELLPVLKEDYHVNTLEVFGSYLRGEENELSYLD
jgi:predicted nucleotidyltransferase